MNSRRNALFAVLLSALVAGSCGMRGGSQLTMIDGLTPGGGGGTGSGAPVTPGANLTASAPGITPTEIHIATIQDISGPVPGLFETALDGMKAWVAYQNSHGGLDGRHIVLDAYDAGLNPTKYQQAMTQACSQDFAVVGTMSTVDDAGAVQAQQCGIPDIPDNPTTPKAGAGTDVFPVNPSMPNQYPTGWFLWVKQHYPSAASHAAIMWPDVSVTQLTGERVRDTAESVGFHFVYQTATPIVDADYLPNIQAMKSAGVQYFAWQADYQSMARMLQAMQQLGWKPKVVDTTATAYNQEFLNTAGSAANGIFLTETVALFSEAAGNPSMQSYLSWLDKTVPGHQPPDIFGIYSWAAGTMLAQALSSIGANPTRAQMISSLQGIHHFTGGGMVAPTDPAGHKASTCFEVLTVTNDKFVRVYPTQPNTFDCSAGTLYVDPKLPAASLTGS